MELLTKPAFKAARPDAASLTLKKILVPVDFSPFSEKAFEQAQQLAQQFKSELVVLHVLEPVVPVAFEGLSINLPDSTEESSVASKALKSMAASARNSGVMKVKTTIVHGLASHEIVEMAKEFDADLIVIATHGYTGWKHFCIGSTAERVVRAAHCPVLVVRQKEYRFA